MTVLEAAGSAGGGTRSEPLTRDGFVHDVCSAVHPLALASPALRDLPLAAYGVRWRMPAVAFAHPLDGGRAAALFGSVDDTAAALGRDGDAYRALMQPLVDHGADLVGALLSPISVPSAPLALARFGTLALRSAAGLARARFESDEARALLVGTAAHSILPLSAHGTAGYGLFMQTLGHLVGWPVVEGGSQRLADALVAILRVIRRRRAHRPRRHESS